MNYLNIRQTSLTQEATLCRSDSSCSTQSGSSSTGSAGEARVSLSAGLRGQPPATESLQFQQKMISYQMSAPKAGAYAAKRKTVLKWVARLADQFGVSRAACAAAQHLADTLFSRVPLSVSELKLNLVSLLILASKHLDNKLLYTSHAAYIQSLDLAALAKAELQCGLNLGFDLVVSTHATQVEQFMGRLRDRIGLDLHSQNQACYTKLRQVHRVMEKLFVEDNLQPSYGLVVRVARQCLSDLSACCPDLGAFLQQQLSREPSELNQMEMDIEGEHFHKADPCGKIQGYISQWVAGELGAAQNTFRNRKEESDGSSYQDFCRQYFEG